MLRIGVRQIEKKTQKKTGGRMKHMKKINSKKYPQYMKKTSEVEIKRENGKGKTF